MSVSVLPDASGAGSWIADYGTAGPPRAADMATVSSSLDGVLSAELHAAQITLGCTAEDVLLAALGRTVARTIGEGMLIVDVVSGPEVAGFRRVGVPCVARRGLSGSELLAAARPGAAGDAYPSADMCFAHGEGPRVGEAAHPLAVHVHRDSGTTMGLHWRFDTRGFDHCTVQELAEQFPLALIEVTSG
ncbi:MULTISPECIES: polyketide synthase [unclassified Mycolicibacterium]|uniref:polyketide synthase n=1 Tax=unclassified Mycolicibacterium TaxID=2636767 RepID=UPI0012DD9899|nr:MULTISPECIES: polyketide synthase [unclassified Mycolicibacterium]MUL84562.1 polyketide synthase [Mycolicibacterium sp. CBMA 329]MUL88337.1 polyketide synthase [Mycolicibacterium sp. CBMA 331]MUM27555.1 polyketide synthase [Mycolicibacterium sp. CBMA 295]MUM39984.1 polyketide synthase [Mycolicibacterium sp. CBMA 247]MUM44402.1 polyketide synthase [Mycolicibacterium sp. CBMA 294]